jgi:hypothetical protein
MSFQNLDLDDNLPPDEPPPVEESSNRTFLIIAAVLGGVALIALICIGVYALVLRPQANAAQMSLKATSVAQETAVGEIVAGTATSAMMTDIVAAYTATPTNTPIPPTATPTLPPTPVVAVADTAAPAQPGVSPTIAPEAATATARYVTLEAILTQNAGTPTTRPTSTGIPNTGFADDIGLPMMAGMALLLVLVIFLARRLRTAN